MDQNVTNVEGQDTLQGIAVLGKVALFVTGAWDVEISAMEEEDSQRNATNATDPDILPETVALTKTVAINAIS